MAVVMKLIPHCCVGSSVVVINPDRWARVAPVLFELSFVFLVFQITVVNQIRICHTKDANQNQNYHSRGEFRHLRKASKDWFRFPVLCP